MNTRRHTADKAPSADNVPILTAEQIGPNRHILPNGNLLCKDVPIARIGWMVYGPGEVPVEPGVDGLVYVERTAEVLFDPACIGSFMGAALVDEHPQEGDVTPENWRKLARGFVTENVKRGEGDDSDVLLADIIVTDSGLIKSILAGKREVSCGYDAGYEQKTPGVGRQTDILGNHVALVEKGRCGPRCAIGDSDLSTKEKGLPPMATVTKPALAKTGKRNFFQRFRDQMAEVVTELENEEIPEQGEGQHIHLHIGGATNADEKPYPDAMAAKDEVPAADPVEARFVALEKSISALSESVGTIVAGLKAKEPTSDVQDPLPEPSATPADPVPEASKTSDSAALHTSYQQVMAQAEVLVPGFKVPTFDASAKRAATIDAMCHTRRNVLATAYATADGKTLIEAVNGGASPDIAGIDCAAVASLFSSAASTKGLMNNARATIDSSRLAPPVVMSDRPMSIAALNEANKKFWESQSKK